MIDLIIGFVVAGALMILEYIFCWGTGRDKYKKLHQAEMNKMKAKDI